MADNLEEQLLRPQPKWYYKLPHRQVTTDRSGTGWGRTTPEQEARNAMELARKRNQSGKTRTTKWNGKK